MRRALFLLAWAASPAWAAGFRPYPQLDFSASPAQIESRCAAARRQALFQLQQVAEMPDSARTFGNTPEALENILDDLNDRTAAYAFLENVAVSSQTRRASSDCRELMEDFGAYTADEAGGQVFSRGDLYRALKAYAAQEASGGPPLSPVRQRLLDAELLDFKRGGLGLRPERRAILDAVRERIVMLQQDYDESLSEVQDYLLVSKAELAGLPAPYVARLPRLEGQYEIGLDDPDYFTFLKNDSAADARRRLEFLYDNRAAAENVSFLAETLRLRDAAAHILGYPSYAAYQLENRMAQNPERVLDFLKTLQKQLDPAARRELAALAALKAAREGKKSGPIRAWDWRYYENLLKATKYHADPEAARRYFPLGRVLKGLFTLNETLLGVKFERVQDAAVWAPGVELYEIIDDSGRGPVVGYFYMDLFPRRGKYAHAASFELIGGRLMPDGAYQKPVAALVANFALPAPGEPALLSYGQGGEVESLFHEFGRLMDLTLTRAPYERFAGAGAARDFREAPAQVMEDFIWRPEVVALISGDYQDPDKKLPTALFEKFLAARGADAALENLRQVFFARLDMRYHMDPLVTKPTAVYQKMMKKISLIPMTPGTNPEAGFSHLMNGYDAGYYGYLWSKVYAQDIFSRFEDEGVLNPAIGWLYRQEILAPGESRPEAQSLRAFLGRAPSDRAFLDYLGISR
ncbi:MAG TPA: M3 family metallopeptidase [Elusimicrobiota bacterium]|nr:M3 family metallopeptidase [Elusimicrobiota bacterium]